jgi:putative ABC transport system permease protein
MFENYLLVSWRNMLRHSSISLMNIIGLSAGLACSLLIFLWVSDELGFDRFHAKAGRLYRVEEDQHYSNGVFHVTVTPWPSGPVWKEKIPEIEQSCRITSAGSFLFRRKDISFYEEKVLAADSTFFDMFSFGLLEGDPKTVLKEPGSVVITREMAEKYFGGEDPIGKSLQVNAAEVFQVTGVMRRAPGNSSIDQDFLIPFDYMKKSQWYSDNWGNNSISTYVLLRNNVDPQLLGPKLTQIAKANNPQNTTDFIITPLTRLHLFGYWGYGHKPGAILHVWIFASIALLVLIIACINFMNLSTARSATRAKETGLRKVSGAHRKSLILQFFNESLIMAILSMVVAFILSMTLLSPFNMISGKNFHPEDLLQPEFIIGMLIITLFTGILAGTYPAIVLSSFNPIHTLKGALGKGSRGGAFRKVTVVVQFTLSIILITGTIVMVRQLQHMQNQDLGYSKENLLYMHLRGELKKSYPMIREELLREPVVRSITACTDAPQSIGSNSDNASWEGKPADLDVLISMTGVDFDYVETMGIKMKSGRTFSRSYSDDIQHDSMVSFLINEQMEKVMGMKNAVGAQLRFGAKGQIVGVMKDFNFQSLHGKIEPLAISMWGNDFLNYIYISINPGNVMSTMKQLEKAWKRIMPMIPFEYHFVDEDFDKMYRVEERMGSLMRYFAVLAVLIACIGLYGLATFSVEQKTREVGIRKAHGAPPLEIFRLFTVEFIQLLLIASVVSIPVAWYLLSRFLRNYSYHTRLSPWIFLVSAGVTLLLAMVAILFQAGRAIRTNPAETLKHE